MHSIESRCVVGPENMPFAGAFVHLPAQNFTCWGSDGVKTLLKTKVLQHFTRR